MKTLAYLTIVLLAIISARGQGTITFVNSSASRVFLAPDCPVPVGTMFKAALYYHPDQPTAPSYWDFTARGTVLGNAVGFGPVAGFIYGGTRTTPGTTLPGGMAWFQIRVWEAAFGATFEEAWNNSTPIGGRLALVGTSAPVRAATGDPYSLPPTPPGSLISAGLQSFCVGWCNLCIPEPSSVGLLLLGVGLWFVMFRPRREPAGTLKP